MRKRPANRAFSAVDKRVVVPVGKTVRVIITSQDVIHSWTIPAFGAKIDAVPGKLNETWFRANREGVFYGQCSELCGAKHAFMPIAVEVVSQERFDQWIEEAKKKFAQNDSAPDRARRSLTLRNAEHGDRPSRRRSPRPPQPDRLAPLRLFDEPQRHRHDVPDLRDHRGAHRRCAFARYPARTAGAGRSVLRRRRASLQRLRHRARA